MQLSALLSRNSGPEAWTREVLSVLECQAREQSLLGLADWSRLGIAGPQLFDAVRYLRRPAWGHWHLVIEALRRARRNLLQSGTQAQRELVLGATVLTAMLEALEQPLPKSVVTSLGALKSLTHAVLRDRLALGDAVKLAVALRNRIAHDAPVTADWWQRAAAALRPLVEHLALLQPVAVQEVSGETFPWFLVQDGAACAFNGLADDGTAVYVDAGGQAVFSAEGGQAILLCIQRMLGKADLRESDFRRLLSRFAPEEIKGVFLGDFLVGRPVGQGGYATVHIGKQLSTGRQVAVKILNDGMSEESKYRLRQEARFLSQLRHPNIVSVLGFFEEPWEAPRDFSLREENWYSVFEKGARVRSFLALEWVDGTTLEGVFQQETRPDVKDLYRWFDEAAGALSAAHAAGFVHRDVKPGNLMVSSLDQSVRLMDFGIARSQNELRTIMTADREGLGTIAYMSPEQVRAVDAEAEVGPPTDIYGLCATFYEVFTGRRLYDHDQTSSEIIKSRKLSGIRPVGPRVIDRRISWEIDTILLGGLEVEVSDRYRSMADLARDIQHVRQDEPIEYKRPSLFRRCRLSYRRNRPVFLLVAVFILLATGGTSMYWLDLQKTQANALVDSLATADTEDIPKLVDELSPYRRWAYPRLKQLLGRDPAEPKGRLHAHLALLRMEAGHEMPLLAALLEGEPAQILVIRDALYEHRQPLVESLWSETTKESSTSSRRLRAACALASFDPSERRWAQITDQVAEQLVREHPLDLRDWLTGFEPIRLKLIEPLSGIFHDTGKPLERLVAADILSEFAKDQLGTLTELVVDADPAQYRRIFPVVAAQRDSMLPRLREVLTRGLGGSRETKYPDEKTRRQAQAAVVLAQLEATEDVWPLLGRSDDGDPTRRTHLLLGLGRLKTDVRTVLRQLAKEKDVWIRRALILSLGEYDTEALPAEQRKTLVPLLVDWYRNDPDPGIHSAIGWLLGEEKEGPVARSPWGVVATLAQIDQELVGKTSEERGWYVSPQGETFAVIVPPPSKVAHLGSPDDEADREDGEVVRDVALDHRFAVATHDVSVRRFELFLKDNESIAEEYRRNMRGDKRIFNPHSEAPALYVSWYMAAQYCRWLSDKERFDESQMCYPSIEVIEAAKKSKQPLLLPPNYLRRTGYRLPTETEWEYACRAGSNTAWYSGRAEELVGKFAWYNKNAVNQAWPVGEKRPNDFGLFDMHGNAWQLCQDEYRLIPIGPLEPKDAQGNILVTYDSVRVLRGGSFLYRAETSRSALRSSYKPDSGGSTVGFRVVRTCAQ